MNDLGKNQCSIIDSANNTLPYFKNSCYSLQIPLRKSKTEPFSLFYYDPCTNIIPYSGTNFESTDCLDFNLDEPDNRDILFSSSFSNSSEYSYDSISTALNHDSAICMNFKASHLNISEKSFLIFECLRAKIESKHDISSLSNISQSIKDSGFSSLCEISLKRKISSNSLEYLTSEMEVDESSFFEKMSIENEYVDDLNSDVNIFNVSTYRSQSDFVSSDNKIDSSRRYMKWRKSRSSLTITKTLKSRKFVKSKAKFHCKPKVNKGRSRYLKEKNSHNSALLPQRNKKLQNSLKLNNSLFTKICNVVIPATFKQYMPVSPPHQTGEKNLPRQKYTPLLSPLPIPAKNARFSNSKTKSTATFIPDRKIASKNSSSAPFNRCSVKADRSRKDSKPFLVVFFFFYFLLFLTFKNHFQNFVKYKGQGNL